MKEKLINGLFWFFGLLFVARSIPMLAESILGALFLMVAGIILLPIFHTKVKHALGRKIQEKWFVLFAFVLLILSGFFIQASEERALKNGTASQELVDREAKRIEYSQEQERAKAEREANEEAQKQQRQTEREQRNRLVAIQTDSRIALKNYLKDPDSAEIRNHNGNCGEVNSKNSFGGYSGFKRFIASPAIVAIEGENMDTDEFQKAWDQICK